MARNIKVYKKIPKKVDFFEKLKKIKEKIKLYSNKLSIFMF